MRQGLGIALLAAAALAAPPAEAASVAPGHQSWGKTGISYLQYRTDAQECAYAGVLDPRSSVPGAIHPNLQTAQAPPPQAAGPIITDTTALYDAVSSYEADKMMAVHHVAQVMQNATERCLAARGYTRFRLTPEQVERLSRLRQGTPERYRYLYSLAVDPNVLKVQAAARGR